MDLTYIGSTCALPYWPEKRVLTVVVDGKLCIALHARMWYTYIYIIMCVCIDMFVLYIYIPESRWKILWS